MANITLSMEDETKKRMDKHPHVKWSRLVRDVIRQSLDDFEEAERIARKSRLTMKDFEPISRKIKKAAGKRARELLNASHGGR